MDEGEIECVAERMMSRADREYIAGKLTDASYCARVRDITAWCRHKAQEAQREASDVSATR